MYWIQLAKIKGIKLEVQFGLSFSLKASVGRSCLSPRWGQGILGVERLVTTALDHENRLILGLSVCEVSPERHKRWASNALRPPLKTNNLHSVTWNTEDAPQWITVGGGSSFIHPDLRGWSTSATTEAENELWTWRVSLGSKAEHGWLKQADSAASLGLQPPSPANCCDPHSCINYPVQRWQLIKWRLTKERRGIRVIIQHWGKMKSILKMVTAERLNSKLNLSYASGVRFEFQLKW